MTQIYFLESHFALFLAWLQTFPILLRRHSQMLFAVATEVGESLKIHHFSYLRSRQPLVVEQVFEDWHGLAVDVRRYAVARQSADGGRQIFGRYVEPASEIRHLALGAANARSEQVHQAFDNVARPLGVFGGAIIFGMEFKNVVNHRQAQAAHYLGVETQFGVVEPFADAVEVAQKAVGISVRKRNYGVGVEADTAANAVVVGRQQTLQKTVGRGKPLNGSIFCSFYLFDFQRRRNHYKRISLNAEILSVKLETAATIGANQMQAAIRQRFAVDSAEIDGVCEGGGH